MTRLFARVLEVFLLAVIFTISAIVTSIACSVTSRVITSSSYNDCSPIGTIIYKLEENKITFSDGDFDNIQVYGLGSCAYPSISGSQKKCAPAFNTPTTIGCVPAASNCVRWSQLVVDKVPSCGLFSCTCADGPSNQFTLPEYCWNEATAGTCGGALDFSTYPSTGCATGFVSQDGICQRPFTYQQNCAPPSGYSEVTCDCPDGTGFSPILIECVRGRV